LNKGTLPIVARLKALQDPSHIAAGGGRVIADLHDPSPVAALLREVNETILARSLRFESAGGSSLTLDVAGRRVLRLTEATGVTGAESCLAAPALEDEHKDDLIRLMQAVAAPRHELRVSSRPMEREVDGMSVGLPVALVADLLLIELNDVPGVEVSAPPAAPPREVRRVRAAPVITPVAPVEEEVPEAVVAKAGVLGRLASGLGPALIAWLIVGGDEDGRLEGPEEMVSHLRGFLDDEATSLVLQLDLVSNERGAPVCMVLGAALIEGHCIVCARVGAAILLGVIEGDASQNLLRAWSGAMA
jgi:hypothetical protein